MKIQILNSITNIFTFPEFGNQTPYDSFRGRVLIGSTLIPAVLVTPFILIRGAWDGYSSPTSLILMFLIIVLFLTPFIYRYTASIVISGVFVNLLSSIVLMVYTYVDGGFFSTTIPWFPILPLFGVFYSGAKYGIAIALLLLLYLIVLYFLHQAGHVPSIDLDESQFVLLYALSISSVLIILLALALLYVAWQKAIQSELEAVNRAKDEFLSGISHELRTPLNSILGFSEILITGYGESLTEKQAEFISNINDSGTHLLALVNGLLDISKIESGTVEFQPSLVRVADLFSATKQFLQDEIKTKEITLVEKFDSSLSATDIFLDEIKIRQVLINLLSNAVRFTPQGGTIEFASSIVNKVLVIKMQDSGPGIPKEFHEKVFDRFFQVHTEYSTKDEGTGLGLAISRRFIEMHGGQIYLDEPVASSGSCFVIEIPLSHSSNSD